MQGNDSTFYVELDITASEFRHYYSQNINRVITVCHTGQKIQFPANILQPFVSHSGVQGKFKIVIDEKEKFKSINRIT